jgi:hypothetical protein
MEQFGKAVLTTVSGFLISLAGAATVRLMWRWYVVPATHFPEISLTVAFGLGLLVSLMTFQPYVEISENPSALAINTQRVLMISMAWFYIGIIHLFFN